MSNQTLNPKSHSTVENRLKELKEVPARNPLKAASGRMRFLKEAAEYQRAVSPGTRTRHKGWIFPIRKEKFAMNVFISLFLAASLLLGGGATVAAAQDDLPNQSLYQLKLWTENAKMAMAGDPQEKATLLMTMAQTRVQEMAALAEQGITPPEQVCTRLEQNIDQALRLAAGMDEADREQILLQLHDRLHTQDRLIQQLQTYDSTETEPLLTQICQNLQTHLRQVDDGMADPQGFRYIIQNQMQYGQDEEALPEPNQQGEPGFHQNEESGQPAEMPGNIGGNDSPGGPNPDSQQNGGSGSGSGNMEPSGPNPEAPQGGNGMGGGGNK